jgi:hypothetical protein
MEKAMERAMITDEELENTLNNFSDDRAVSHIIRRLIAALREERKIKEALIKSLCLEQSQALEGKE